MPSLTIKPPRPPSNRNSSSPPRSQAAGSVPQPSSPVAPAYSPITPKVLPAVPAVAVDQNDSPSFASAQDMQTETPTEMMPALASTAHYIPRPLPQPFFSEDSTDAIALQAAISALQFQKMKAQDDVRTLESVRKQALAAPERFKSELAAGRLKEQRPQTGNLMAILDEPDTDEEDATVPGAGRDEGAEDASFSRIPGPQDVVRMPYVNWDKYHIVGEPLDSMHEHQRKWPGSTAYGQERGRGYVMAAPYSPFLDDHQSADGYGSRNDSVASPMTTSTPTGTVSEHPMETRRGSKIPQHDWVNKSNHTQNSR